MTKCLPNEEVSVCFRPEALKIDNNSLLKAEVVELKFRYCYIKMLNDNSVYKIRMSIAFLPKKGDIVGVNVDFNQLFVFRSRSNNNHHKTIMEVI